MKYRLLRFSLLSVLVMLFGGGIFATFRAGSSTPLIDFPTSDAGITPNGTTTKTQESGLDVFKLANGYTGDKVGNNIGLSVEGGFKKGDIITVAGFINKADKRATVVLFTAEAANGTPTNINKFEDFVNLADGKTINDITEQSYTLEADYSALYLGRDGGTGCNVSIIKVVRPNTGDDPEPAVSYPITATWDFAGEFKAFDDVQGATTTFTNNGITLTVDATNGKIRANGNSANLNAGTIAKIPVNSTDDEITVVAYGTNYALYTIGGTDPNGETTFKYKPTAAEVATGHVQLVSTNNNCYIISITIIQQEASGDKPEPVTEDCLATWDFEHNCAQLAPKSESGAYTAETMSSDVKDIEMTIDYNGGQIKNNDNSYYVSQGVEMQIPVKNAGDVVTVTGYPGYYSYSVAGTEATEQITVYTAKAADAAQGYVPVVSTGSNNYYLSISVLQKAPKDPSEPELVEKSIFKTNFSEWEELTSSKEESVVAKTTKFTNEELNFTFYNTGVNTGTYDESKFPNNNGYRIFCEKNAGGYVVTSALANISKVRFVHAATGGSRGYKLEAKGEGDEDWVVISDSYANPSGWCEVTANVNKDNCQLRFTNLAEAQYAYIFELEIFGKVDLSNEPLLETLTANGKTYNADDIFEMESDGKYHATIELASNETMVDASNPVTAVAANGVIGEITYDTQETANIVTIPVTVKEKTVNYVAAFVRKPMLTLTYVGADGQEIGTQQVEKDAAIGEFAYDINSVAATKDDYKARGWFKQNYIGEKYTTASTFTENATLYAVETEIEVSSESRKYEFNLTDKNFYAEDHEAFNPTGGAWHDTTHGWSFSNGNTIDLLVGTKATISITTCKYPEGGETKIAASNGVEVPAISATDGAGQTINYEGEAGTLTLTISGGQCYIHKIVINNTAETSYDKDGDWLIVKANDAISLIDALEIANGTAEQRQYVFIPNGTYDLGTQTLTTISGSNVSVIGESMEGVIIKNRPIKEGIDITATLLNTGSDNYFQDMTIDCIAPWGGNAERGVALQDKGTNTICKNVYLKGLQDTYYSNSENGTYYFEDGKIEGSVDYVCGYGDIYFNGVQFYTVNKSTGNAGGCIAAPNKLKSFGYIFSNCTFDGMANEDGKYRLARPWAANTIVKMINTKMIIKPSAAGWGEWSPANAVTQFAEYNSVDAEGSAIDLSQRATTIGGQPNTPILTTDEAAACAVDAIFVGDWKPAQLAKQLEAPAAEYANGTVTWTPANDGAIAYMIEKNGKFVGITTGSSMTVEANVETDKLTIRAANGRGGFGEAKQVTGTGTSIQAVNAAIERGEQVIFNLAGQRVNKATKGMYIINGKKVVIK